MTQELPPSIRAMAYAGGQLALDLMYLLQSYYKLDFETIYILLSVNDATMRPLMAEAKRQPHLLGVATPPEALRGGISRSMIAEKTGLPRETVRRKCQELIASGQLLADAEDKLRIPPRLAGEETQALLRQVHSAIRRYDATLEEFGGS